MQTRNLRYLHRQGAHLLRVLPDKSPVRGRSWLRQRAGEKTLVKHDGLLGLVPNSLELSVLDLDRVPSAAALTALLEQYPPLLKLPSQRPDRWHLYYLDEIPRPNGSFAAFGCSGDVRSANGYVVLWGEAGDLIAETLRQPVPSVASDFPAHLMNPYTRKPPARRRGPKPKGRNPVIRPEELYNLALIPIGHRHLALFYNLRYTAYRTPRGNDYSAWEKQTIATALEQNLAFAAPLPESKVTTDARYVARWCWEHLNPHISVHDFAPEKQALRGQLSGAARRTGTPLEHDPEPWEGLNISRRTWYNHYRYAAPETEFPEDDMPDTLEKDNFDHHRKMGIKSGEARRKGTPLEQDREPWVKLGISRRTWYNRQREAKEASARFEKQAARSEQGRQNGIKSGETRRKGTPLEQDREPWVKLGISRSTWYNHQREAKEASDEIEKQATRSEQNRQSGIKSGEARRKGTPLEEDREPWVKLGISRRTWYDRQRKAKELPDGHESQATQSEQNREKGIKSGEARRKGTPLELDPKPWEAMGISRGTWYRKHRNEHREHTTETGDEV